MTNLYKCCYIDFDTVLYRSSKSVQKSSILVTHNEEGWSKQFDGVSKFYGLGNTKAKGWIGEENVKREQEGKPLYDVSQFTIENIEELNPELGSHKNILMSAMDLIDYRVGAIKKVCNADKYVLGIGGNSNFRYEAAHILPYKGKRVAKPIIFEELREAFIKKYGSKVSIARDGMEQDDEISIRGWESYFHSLKTGSHKYVLGFIDKDLLMVPCPSFNYDKPEDGITIPTIEDCARMFCSQLLSGDKSTDNIQGLPDLSKEFRTKYSIGQHKGVGKATALKVLEGCNSPVEMYNRVVEAYKSFYGVSSFEFTSHRGEVSQRIWLDMLRENALLLHMMRKPNERYDIEETFKRLGVDYENNR